MSGNLEGNFIARAMESEIYYTKDNKPYISVCFCIEEGEHNGQLVYWNGYFTEKTARRTIESLKHCGWKGDDISDLDGISDNLVQITVEKEIYNDREVLRVRWVNKIGTLPRQTAMSVEDKKVFAKKIRGTVLDVIKDVETDLGVTNTDKEIDEDNLPF